MAEAQLTVHVVLCECSEAEVVERVSRIIADHVATAREGVVPALLAEDLVATLRAQHALLFAADLEDDA